MYRLCKPIAAHRTHAGTPRIIKIFFVLANKSVRRIKKMANIRRFLLQNHYFQLEETVSSIIPEEDYNAYDFLIVPPDPGAITDEEVSPEDDLATGIAKRCSWNCRSSTT
ncbi:hypothetical protein HHI36_006010 [Cryptolaemus montrouzieri]|uniref:Uncharacterized protein n=1 Tax=Cryptolaemus montrouzieri TaxID=559131 RepID=A0ABD2NWR1_9CUCU